MSYAVKTVIINSSQFLLSLGLCLLLYYHFHKSPATKKRVQLLFVVSLIVATIYSIVYVIVSG